MKYLCKARALLPSKAAQSAEGQPGESLARSSLVRPRAWREGQGREPPLPFSPPPPLRRLSRARRWKRTARQLMASSRLPPTALTLKQFLRRQQVLQLYRKILKAVRQVPNEADRCYLRDWAKEEFKRNKGATDEDAIRMMITQGNLQLEELERTLKLANS